VGYEDAEFEDDDGDVENASEDVEFVLRDWWGVLVSCWVWGAVERGTNRVP
jgi:hypothetical protein